jgi:uncharacterized DUF497 family protein
MSRIKFQFDWDLAKPNSNFSKHRIRFAESLAVFDDPLAVTRPDVEHGRADERWITVGQADARLIALVHALAEGEANSFHLRIISSRRLTADERRQYESGKYRIEEAIMKSEYDSEQWERGKFYREGAIFLLPFHLEASIYRRISRLAADVGVPATDLAGELLTRGMDELDATAARGCADGGQGRAKRRPSSRRRLRAGHARGYSFAFSESLFAWMKARISSPMSRSFSHCSL